MSKRRWWRSDARMARVARRLRANYRAALAREVGAANRKCDERVAAANRRADNAALLANQKMREQDEMYVRLLAEVARVRVEMHRAPSFSRFVATTSFSDAMLRDMRDLEVLGPFVARKLCAQLEHELVQIDFARIRPTYSGPDRLPTWVLSDTDALTSGGKP